MAQQDGDTPKHGRSAVCLGAYRLAIGFATHTTEDDNDREVIPGAGAFAPGPWKRGVVACAMGRVFLFVCASTFLCQSVGRCTACVCACACVGGWVVKGWFANRNEKSFDVPVLLCLCACAYP